MNKSIKPEQRRDRSQVNLEYLPVNALTFMMGEYVRGLTSAEGEGPYADKRLGRVALVKWDHQRSNTFRLCSVAIKASGNCDTLLTRFS